MKAIENTNNIQAIFGARWGREREWRGDEEGM